MPPPNRKRPTSKASDQRSRPGRGKPKVCIFCADHSDWVDYKDTNLLRRFISDRGKIRSRNNTGTCAQHQRDVATAYGSRASSRAVLIAVATSRWCWAQVPVLLRERILPRSLMNRRNRSVSL